MEQGPDPVPRRLDRAFDRMAEQSFELGKDLFDRTARLSKMTVSPGPL